eukprot:2664421-Pyramimonas_sp.AAC.1
MITERKPASRSPAPTCALSFWKASTSAGSATYRPGRKFVAPFFPNGSKKPVRAGAGTPRVEKSGDSCITVRPSLKPTTSSALCAMAFPGQQDGEVNARGGLTCALRLAR